MARNFRVLAHRKSATLHLRLAGDFDGGSAFDLLKILEENCCGIESVIIHTSGLKDIYPYGRDIFQKNLYGLIDKHVRLVFIGAHKEIIMPNASKSL